MKQKQQKNQSRIEDKHVLIVTSVEAEKEAVKRGLQNTGKFTVITGGVGPMAAAASTAEAIAAHPYDYVVVMGIAGGFKGRAPVRSIVVATELIASDMGAETEDTFLSLDDLGLGTSSIEADRAISEDLALCFNHRQVPVYRGAVLTSATVTGTKQKEEVLRRRYPNAAAEAMEGFGAATAAAQRGIPILEIRSISNEVGPRNREAWDIKGALSSLETAGAVLKEAFLK
ncbi:futalosine hydrolase [Thalassorhabdus alkalitolerans]|uniref:Futalosine hydrolase n=1 Tax=Thalassorhabdus alkalitolerans TaxID=2282697 RepID=A0ABW0YN97_9BACI